MNDIAIKVENVSKEYKITGSEEGYQTLREKLNKLAAAPFKAFGQSKKKNGNDVRKKIGLFRALDDVSFEVKRGEVMGIIGHNGAGKSTLLKILSRITEPSSGAIDIYGRVGSLLEVGTGFHAELSGRENTYLSGAIIGMRREEINRKFDDIVSFAEVEKFIDTPVKHYSSGMYLRLAFAVAAHLDTEILLIDEVLAVGDSRFQARCLGKMEEVAKQGRTVLFVSHNMAAVSNLCSRIIALKGGQVWADGRSEVIGEYLNSVANIVKVDLKNRTDLIPAKKIWLTDLWFTNDDGKTASVGLTGGKMAIHLEYERLTGGSPDVTLTFYDTLGHPVAGFCTSFARKSNDGEEFSPKNVIKCIIPKLPLLPGEYRLNVLLHQNGNGQTIYRRSQKYRWLRRFLRDGKDSSSRHPGTLIDHYWEIGEAEKIEVT